MFIVPKRGEGGHFNVEHWEALRNFYMNVDDSKASEGLAVLEMAKCANEGNYTGVVNVMRDVKKYNLIGGFMKPYCIMYSMEVVRLSKDQTAIAEGIKYIGINAFEGCEFKSITLPKSLEYLGTSVFQSCKNLEYFDLGGYKELPDSTLSHCDAIREVVGLENVTRLGKHSLGGDYLTNIRLTSALQYIDEYAFGLTNSLSRVYFDGTVAEWNAIPKGYHWNYNLPATNVICNDGKGDPGATMGKK